MEIADPIQRAGMRLLSAAAVPIQTEIRRYLAKKEAEDRIWGIIVVQSYFRRWRAELTMYRLLYCATKIQSSFRGWLVRDTIRHKTYCATQIQRVCRGYLATMKVYEALYNITVVQSIARRNAAIQEAEFRYRSIIRIQSLIRGVRCRRVIKNQHEKATTIQTVWRRFITQLNYQFDMVDIIIVQSIARKRACQKRYAAMIYKRHTKAAIVIQKYWRGYDCTMNYLHSIADILIVQSIFRRWMAMRFVPMYREHRHNEMATRIQTAARGWVARRALKKYKAAVNIQKSWRGFKQYIEYIFTISDIVLVQKTARVWLAKRCFEETKIQRREENITNAAITIQKVWRGHRAQMNMLFTLVHIIIVQSVIRRRTAIVKFKPMLMEYRAAITIQCAWRVKGAKRIHSQQTAARKIQAAVRRWFGYSCYKGFMAARKIQSWYRCHSTRRGYLYYISARTIQTIWRGYDARKLADEERWVREYAATMIQKTWRMHSQQQRYTEFSKNTKAVTTIQTQWRCFWEYSHFVILRYELIRIQAAVRGYQTRKLLKMQHENATVIQTAARVMLARRFCHMERLFSSVMHSAQMSLTQKNAAKKIQRGFRQFKYSMSQKKAALVIERFFIWVRSEVEEELQRREQMKILRRQKRRSKKNLHDDDLLENVWDKTLVSSSEQSKIPVLRKNNNKTTDRTSVSPVKSTNSFKRSPYKVREASPTKSRASSIPVKMSSSPSLIKQKIPYGLHTKSRSLRNNDDLVPLDIDDTLSVISGLSTPTLTPRYLKHKTKATRTSLDDELDLAWEETKRKVLEKRRRLPQQIEESDSSSKENSLSPPKTRMDSMSRKYDQGISVPKSPTRRQPEISADILRFSQFRVDR